MTLIKIKDDPPPGPGSGSNVISISFQPGLIGPGDKNLIMHSLGMNDAEVQSNCYFKYSTLLSYGSTSGGFVSSGTATSMQQRFSGPLTLVQIYPSVACRKLRTPVSGMVVEQGGAYVTSLNAVDCSPGDKSNASSLSLAFRYTGDGKGECRYQ